MKAWLDRFAIAVLTVIVTILAVTAWPTLFGGHLEGNALLLHMMASGALVGLFPLFSLYYVGRSISRYKSGSIERFGFWTLLVAGLVTIASVFLCMLPIASTDQMHELIKIHGYAGFAMVPALVLLIIGASRWRRIQSTRSATPG